MDKPAAQADATAAGRQLVEHGSGKVGTTSLTVLPRPAHSGDPRSCPFTEPDGLPIAWARRLFALALIGVLLSGCGSSVPMDPRRAHTNLISILEDEGFLHEHPARALRRLQSLGVHEVRVFVPWSSVAPAPAASGPPSFDASDPADYPPGNWKVLDEIVRDAAARKVGVDFTVGGPAPAWTEGPGAPAAARMTAAGYPPRLTLVSSSTLWDFATAGTT